MSDIPEDLYYADTHEWAKQENDALIRVGITDFAQQQLGDLVFVDLPKVGQYFSVNDPCATVESVKSVSQLYAPVTGVIVDINQEVIDEPQLVNDAAYVHWLFCMKADDIDELETLMNSRAYNDMIAE